MIRITQLKVDVRYWVVQTHEFTEIYLNKSVQAKFVSIKCIFCNG